MNGQKKLIRARIFNAEKFVAASTCPHDLKASVEANAMLSVDEMISWLQLRKALKGGSIFPSFWRPPSLSPTKYLFFCYDGKFL